MTDLELDRALAVAIGYGDDAVDPDVQEIFGGYGRTNWVEVWHAGMWLRFSHSDWRVIGPVAERYRMFPSWNVLYGQWTACKAVPRGQLTTVAFADTPQRAIALAVVEAHRRGVLK